MWDCHGCELLVPFICEVVLVGIFILFPVLEEMLSQLFSIEVILAVIVSYMAFTMLRYVPSIQFDESIFFNHEWMLNFVKCFL